MAITYKDAGVDVEAGYEAVKLMKRHIARTLTANVLGDIGSFGGFYALDAKDTVNQPVLVAGTDGVGTKLKLAFMLDKHDTVGIDCVAMCVNDVVCQGARPLFFLDYLATGRLEPHKAADIVKGIAEGCVQAGCSLIGGETAEMPGFYPEGEYDLAGFSVGIVNKTDIINGSSIKKGDVLIGLPSSGVHSNGFSLVRRLFGTERSELDKYVEDFGCTLGEELLKPTVIYVKTALDIINSVPVKGMAHITGGGFIENIPRIIPTGLGARIRLGSWPVLPVFERMVSLGDLECRQAYNTFNMGIGMVLAVSATDAESLLAKCKDISQPAYIIGDITQGEGVELCS